MANILKKLNEYLYDEPTIYKRHIKDIEDPKRNIIGDGGNPTYKPLKL